MRQILAKVLMLLGLCGVFVVSWNCKTTHAPAEDGDPSPYNIVPERIYLDTAWARYQGASGTVRITNIMQSEDGVLEFKGFDTPTCPSEVTWEPNTATLATGESVEVLIRYERETPEPRAVCSLYPEYETNIDLVKPEESPRLLLWYASNEAACGLESEGGLDFGEVQVGTTEMLTFTVRNETTIDYVANQFRYVFDDPSSNCHLFTINQVDTVGIIGPNESKDITVAFSPRGLGEVECSRSLSSLREPANADSPNITNACPAEVVWRGTGTPAPPAPLAWNDCSKAGFDYDLTGLFGLSENEIYLAGVLGNVLRSDWACDWDLVGTPFAEVNLTDIWAHSTASDTAIWAVGNLASNSTTGAILRSDGSTWDKVDEGWMVHYGAVWGSALDDVYFVGTGVSTDLANTKYWNGSTIDTFTIDIGWSELTSVHGTASDDVWAVLRQSMMSNSVYRFQGTAWEAQTLPFTTNPLHDVWAVQGTGFYAVYAVGEDGAIYHYNGSNWIDESIAGETDDFYGVWVSQTGQAWVVGQNGAIYHKSGTNWTLQNPPAGLERDLHDVWGSSDENVFAVGAGGLILRYTP